MGINQIGCISFVLFHFFYILQSNPVAANYRHMLKKKPHFVRYLIKSK